MLVQIPQAADKLFSIENDYESSPFHQRDGNISISLISFEAQRLGFQVNLYKKMVFDVVYQGRRVAFLQNSPENSAVYTFCAKNKSIAKRLLQRDGVKVAEGLEFEDRDSALRYFESCNWPVVIKPVNKSHGTGVTTGVGSRDHFMDAWDYASRFSSRVIVEKHLSGYDLRVIVVGGVVVSAYARLPASVIGDGKSTIRELVDSKNRQRMKNPSASISLIRRFDFLEQSGRSLGEVPGAGEYVQLASVANISAGGDAVQIIEFLGGSVLDTALKAAACFPGLAQVGVDLIVDESKEQVTAEVIEINGNPSVSSSVFPSYGRPVNLPERLLKFAFSSARAGAKTLDDLFCAARPYILGEGVRKFATGTHPQRDLISQAAYAANLRVNKIDDLVFEITDDCHRVVFYKGIPDLTSVVSLKICRDRNWVREVIGDAGVVSGRQPSDLLVLCQYRMLMIDGRFIACVFGGPHPGNANDACNYREFRRDVTDLVHPGFVDIACRSVEAVFSPYLAGVDVIASDIAAPPGSQAWRVDAVVCNPSLALHHFPTQGIGRDVAGSMIQSLFPEAVSNPVSPRSVHAVICGDVQGIGYGKWLKRKAVLHGLSGWVRNRADGNVEMLLEGSPASIESIMQLARTGHSQARVASIQVEDHPQVTQFNFTMQRQDQ
ncbi:acylphosphatase [Microbulbifer sediminum]|uniref:acylphosphatase n=1 Tax=Microbulbifer sediminum TaxID=2904250 RepID=UPI001F40CEA9|nr:acylphosphatase [Microbulbifer sediminum]